MKSNLNEAESMAIGHDELEPGATLLAGQYTIVNHLASGGFGITYLAKDSLARDVVIKECFIGDMCRRTGTLVTPRSRSHSGAFGSIVNLFMKEAQNQAKLEHPNIARVHQVFKDNDTAYMSIDYIDGRDMQTIIDSGQKTHPETVQRWMRELLSAVGFVHENGVLHRDISPDNILINQENHPFLIDFGSARETVQSEAKAVTVLRAVKDGYSPQEFYIQGGKEAPSGDIYSLAATFYHLVSGKPPIDSQTRLAGIAESDQDPLPPLLGQVDGYPDNFLASIDKAMNVLANERFQSVKEWKMMLGGGAAPTSAPAAAVAAAIDEVGSTPVADAEPSPREALAPEVESKGKSPVIAIAAVTGILGAAGFIGYQALSGGDDAAPVEGGTVVVGEAPNGQAATSEVASLAVSDQFVEAEQQAAAAAAALEAEQEAARVAAEQEAARVAAEQEAARIAAEQEAARIAAEEKAARLAAEQEAARIAAEERAAQVAAELEAARAAAAKAAETAAAEEAARIAAEQEAKRITEELEAARLAAEESARIAAQEEAARVAAEEAARIASEVEAAREAAEEDAAREAAAQEAARIAAEREAARKAAEDAARIAAQEEAARIAAEEEAARIAKELEAARQAAEKSAAAAAAEESARIAAEEEAARIAAELETARLAAEEAARQAAEETARLDAEREAARQAAEQEAARIAAEQEAARQAAEEEMARLAAEEEARKAAEAAAAEQQQLNGTNAPALSGSEWTVLLPFAATSVKTDSGQFARVMLVRTDISADIQEKIQPGAVVFTVNGEFVSSNADILRAVSKGRDLSSGAPITAKFQIKPAESDETKEVELTFDVGNRVVLNGGYEFLTTKESSGAWKTRVAAVPNREENGVRIGDVVLSEVQTGIRFTGKTDVANALSALSLSGQKSAQFGVFRDGALITVTLPLE